MSTNLSNPQYWDQRYQERGIEGSGAGSRGEKVKRKVKFVQELVNRYGIGSIFDYGCGNSRVIKGIKADRKMGYDFSPTIVDQVNDAGPNGTEITNDLSIATSEKIGEFDCVMCMEVLFHNSDAECERILKTIADARVRLFICCDSIDDAWSLRFFGRHIKPDSSRGIVDRLFRDYEQVTQERFIRGSELYALLRS